MSQTPDRGPRGRGRSRGRPFQSSSSRPDRGRRGARQDQSYERPAAPPEPATLSTATATSAPSASGTAFAILPPSHILQAMAIVKRLGAEELSKIAQDPNAQPESLLNYSTELLDAMAIVAQWQEGQAGQMPRREDIAPAETMSERRAGKQPMREPSAPAEAVRGTQGTGPAARQVQEPQQRAESSTHTRAGRRGGHEQQSQAQDTPPQWRQGQNIGSGFVATTSRAMQYWIEILSAFPKAMKADREEMKLLIQQLSEQLRFERALVHLIVDLLKKAVVPAPADGDAIIQFRSSDVHTLLHKLQEATRRHPFPEPDFTNVPGQRQRAAGRDQPLVDVTTTAPVEDTSVDAERLTGDDVESEYADDAPPRENTIIDNAVPLLAIPSERPQPQTARESPAPESAPVAGPAPRAGPTASNGDQEKQRKQGQDTESVATQGMEAARDTLMPHAPLTEALLDSLMQAAIRVLTDVNGGQTAGEASLTGDGRQADGNRDNKNDNVGEEVNDDHIYDKNVNTETSEPETTMLMSGALRDDSADSASQATAAVPVDDNNENVPAIIVTDNTSVEAVDADTGASTEKALTAGLHTTASETDALIDKGEE